MQDNENRAAGDPQNAPDANDQNARRDSGRPGGGAGRRDDVGKSGVYPMSAGPDNIPADAEIHTQASWGQGDRGAEGYNDSGGSELVMENGQLLGGLDVGPNGAPATNAQGGAQGQNQAQGQGGAGQNASAQNASRQGSSSTGSSDNSGNRTGGNTGQQNR